MLGEQLCSCLILSAVFVKEPVCLQWLLAKPVFNDVFFLAEKSFYTSCLLEGINTKFGFWVVSLIFHLTDCDTVWQFGLAVAH